jgi:hypothetical protein
MQNKSDRSIAVDVPAGEAGRTSRDICPLCRSPVRTPFKTVTRFGSHHEIVKCSGCGFVYAATARFDTADHGEISTLYWRFLSRHNQIRRLIHQHLKPGSRIVEIGCGRGELGYIMEDDPYTYVGYDPADGPSKFGQEHGVNIVHDFFKSETAGASDAIVIDNVLEHVLDPLNGCCPMPSRPFDMAGWPSSSFRIATTSGSSCRAGAMPGTGSRRTISNTFPCAT